MTPLTGRRERLGSVPGFVEAAFRVCSPLMMGGSQGNRRSSDSAEWAAAWLSTLVFEALDKVASPQARNDLIEAALTRASLARLPADPDALLAFAVGALREAVADGLGHEAGEAMVQDLEPILQHAAASTTPTPEAEVTPRPARSTRPPSPDGRRQTLPLAGQRGRGNDALQSGRGHDVRGAPPVQGDSGSPRRRTFPYLHRVLRQENARHAVLVDDVRAFLAGFAGAFREGGFEVFTAPDGPAALALCKRLQPELVVVDVAMPDLDVGALLQELEEALGARAPRVAVLADFEASALFDSPLSRTFPKGTDPAALVSDLGGEVTAER